MRCFRGSVILACESRRASELFLSDKVVASDPVPRTWVEYGGTVDLEVQRRVPDVIDASYADAVTTLNKWKLRPTTPGKSGPSDIVVEQEPMAGTYVSPLAEVGLTLRLMTPDVLNRRQTDAVAVLAKYDLRWDCRHQGLRKRQGRGPRAACG